MNPTCFPSPGCERGGFYERPAQHLNERKVAHSLEF